jgi:type I restriction enzyme S subunit
VPKLAFELPPEWVAICLDDVSNLVTSGSRGWAEHYAKTGPKFVRAQNIRFGKLRLDDLACVNPPAQSEGRRTRIAQGDLLIVITGAGVTNPARMDRDLGEAYVSQHVALIKPTIAALSPWLLLCLMACAGGRDQLVERAYGAGKPGLNLDNIRTLNLPLPPLAEQERIVEKVGELMTLCDALEVQLSEAESHRGRLLEAVLHEALVASALAEAA